MKGDPACQYACIYIYLHVCIYIYMGVSKNSGTPKWMVYYIRENYIKIKMDDLGVPLFLETPIYIYTHSSIYSGGPAYMKGLVIVSYINKGTNTRQYVYIYICLEPT